MVLGAMVCPRDHTRELADKLREIKISHGIPAIAYELKWRSVSNGKLDYYKDVADFFFAEPSLRFRAVIADKSALDHERFGQTHDDWYYKMMYQLLHRLLSNDAPSRIYLDKKDTRSGDKVNKLHQVLGNSIGDPTHQVIERIQIVESHHVALMQLADFFIGAISYQARGLSGSPARVELVRHIEEQCGHSLVRSTSLSEDKFNIFRWEGR